jgi:predicted CXXCH cytochrome family protein
MNRNQGGTGNDKREFVHRDGRAISLPDSRSTRLLLLLLATALTATLTLLIGAGCSDDGPSTTSPDNPESPFSFDQFRTYPGDTTVWIGDTLQVVVDVTGSGTNLKAHWSADVGTLTYTSGNFAIWKAPDQPVVAKISVLVYNDDHSFTAALDVPVVAYIPRNEPAYTGAGTCGLNCHDVDGHGENYDSWIGTRHANAFELVRGEILDDGSCRDCHTVGFSDQSDVGWPLNNGGYDEVPLVKLEGVQCENCHGPLADRYGMPIEGHGSSAGGDWLLDPGTALAPTGCGTCHENYGKPYVTEWAASAHATSQMAEGTDNLECWECHTAQGFIRKVQGDPMPDQMPSETHGITCAACHDPHDDTNVASLRFGHESNLCRRCHSDASRGYPNEPHSPQLQLLTGSGGYSYGQILDSTPHRNLLTRGCVTCHYPTTNGKQSHTFEADPASCEACHPSANGTNFNWSTEMAQIAGLLSALNSELNNASEADRETDAYRQAQFNARFVEADASSGAHNYLYAKQLLEASIADFEPAGN